MDYQPLLAQLNTDLEDIERRRELLSREEELTRDAIASVEKLIEMRRAPVTTAVKKPKAGDSDCARCGNRKHRGACRGVRPVVKAVKRFHCGPCNADVPESSENEHTRRHVLALLRCGEAPRLVAEKLRISVGRVAAYRNRVNNLGRPRVDQSKIEAGAALVRDGATIGEAASAVGVHRNTLGPAVRSNGNVLVAEKEAQGREASQKLKDYRQQVRNSSEKNHSCGKCITRYIDGSPFFSAQPDCPEHGLGLGVAQEGGERKNEPP